MQHYQMSSTLMSTKRCDVSNVVHEKSRRNEEASSSLTILRTLDSYSRKPLESIDLTRSDDKIINKPSNQSKSLTKKPESKSSRILSTVKKYFLRHKIDTHNVTLDEDTEDIISKLSVYKILPKGNFGCELCSAKDIRTIVEKKTLIIRHLLRAHTYCHTYECSSCSSSFKKKSWLKTHCETEHSEADDDKKMFECAKCEHKSKDQDLLRLHVLRKHAATYRYVCRCCAKCFKTWRAKNEHEKMKERGSKSENEPKYVCDMCDDILETKQDLIEHLRDIHAEKFYKNGVKILRNCKHCNKLFMSHKSLRDHLLNHDKKSINDFNVEGYGCEICGKQLSSKDHLKKHARVHSGERPYVCPECGQAFALRTTMRIHALSHRGVKPYICELCELGYSQRSALMTHWKSKHKGLPAPPPIEIHQYFDEEGRVLALCEWTWIKASTDSKEFASSFKKPNIVSRIRVRTASELAESSLFNIQVEQIPNKTTNKVMPKNNEKSDSKRKHSVPFQIANESISNNDSKSTKTASKKTKPDVSFQSVEMEKRISETPQELEAQMFKRLKNGGFGCKVCHARYTHRYKVKQHIKIKHSPREIYKCTKCSKSFKSKYQFNVHTNQHQENNTDFLFCCDKCDYRAKSKHYLKTHEIRKHTTEYNFGCDHCGKRFKMKMDLKFHLGTHGASQHMCDACGRMYTSQDSLYKHRRVVHVNEYKFQCGICHQKLLTQENYNTHMESHKSLHKCDECDLKFAKKYYVTRHKKRVHKLEKTHLCPVCGKAFVCMATLRVHYLTHAKVKPYMCNVCGFSFTQRSSMMLHWKRKHPDAEDPPPPVILTNFFDAIQSEVNKLVETTTNLPSNESCQSGTTAV